jgi:hypothetical protein
MQVQPSDPLYKLKKKQQNPNSNHYGPASTEKEHCSLNGGSGTVEKTGGTRTRDGGKSDQQEVETGGGGAAETEEHKAEEEEEEDLDDFFASLE